MEHLTALENRAAALAGPDVLRSPWAPSVEDVKSLEQMHFDLEECLPHLGVDIRQTDARVRALERALRLSRHRLESLKAQLVRVARQAKVCKATSKAFIRRLPLEVLATIFSLVLEPGSSFYGRELHSITATCSWWRSVALSALSLWSTICLAWSSRQFDDRYPRTPNAALVRAQLKYSANAPLDVTVTMDILGASECAHAAYDGYWAAVREQSHRWRTADICWYCKSSWRNASVLALPMLERLTITDPHGKAIPYFADAPNLRTAIVQGFHKVTCPQPWQLTSLTVYNVHAAEALPALQQLSQTLECLKVRSTRRSITGTPDHSLISLPGLKLLDLQSYKQCQAFCPFLIVPALETLSIDTSDWDADSLNADQYILEMARRSSAPVTKLLVRDLKASRRHLLVLLKGLSTLKSLSLDADFGHTALDEQFFRALTPTAENPDCPLPDLVEFSIVASNVYDPACIDFATLSRLFSELRRENVTVNGLLYPALKVRSLRRTLGDDKFSAYDSDDDDEEFIPDSTDTDDGSDYSTDLSDDSEEPH